MTATALTQPHSNGTQGNLLEITDRLLSFLRQQAANCDSAIPFPTRKVSDLLSPKPIEWLVDGLIEKFTVNLIFGPSASCKSLIALDIATRIVADRPWHGRTVAPGPVLYLAPEGSSGMSVRYTSLANYHDLTPQHDLEVLDQAVDIQGWAKPKADTFFRLLATIADFIRRNGRPPALIVIDTLDKSFGDGDENSSRDMRAFLGACDFLCRTAETTVVVIHHTGKDQERGARGSSSIKPAVSGYFEVKRQRDRVEFHCHKVKEGKDGMRFVAEKVDVAWTDLRLRHSFTGTLVVETAEVEGTPEEDDGAGALSAKQQELLNLLRAAGSSGLAGKQWLEAAMKAGIARSTVFDLRKKLLDAGLVREENNTFFAV